ncbi:Mu transposase C-terminal domain-containing protein [Methyloradius palustris]|uniref:Transposase n=1 Tax=Methyloradius palustris TaxID=2778876 RepID=A0A8D5FY35_9PROT|nr:Mu transposase C-terminal domain-containing protein [Methyloradius palustris]BCM24152.1 transposase [Methyloradius palustris]
MLNQSELEAYFENEHLSEEARLVIANVRQSDPSRRTSSGPRSTAIRHPSKKMGVIIQAESSSGELAAVYLWDHDLETHEFYDQPPRIKLEYRRVSDNRLISSLHTPDYFILADGYTGWIECKSEEHLIRLAESHPERYTKDEQGNWRCPPGEAYASSLGLGYKLRSSEENDWTLLRNLIFLSDYMDADCPRPTELQQNIAQALFKQKPWMLLLDLLHADKQLNADAIYKLIVDGDLHFPMYSGPISGPEYAMVYRDDISAEFYKKESTSVSAFNGVNLTSIIDLTPGQKLVWDGSPWKIENVGKKSLFLRNHDGHGSDLSLIDFDNYFREGKITGLPTDLQQEMQDRTYEKICQAGPETMKVALHRFQYIDADSADSNCPISKRSLKDYRRKFRQAEFLYGNGLIGLFPEIHKRGNRNRKIDDTVLELIQAVIDEKYLVATKPKLNGVYGELRNRCKDSGFLPPSIKALSAEIRKRSPYDVVLARSGKRAAYVHEEFYWRLSMEIPRHGERPFDIAHIDHTQVDIQLTDRLTGLTYERPWLSIMLDAYTRKVLAFWISFDEPSYRSCMMVIKNCVREHGRVPRVIVVDGGSEFDGEYFETLVAYLKIQKKSRAKSKARYGSVMERFFGTTNDQLIHNLAGNTQATRTARLCTATHDPRVHSVWTLESFTDLFAKWIQDVYESNPHKTLGISPADAFAIGLLDSGAREHKRISYSEGFKLLCMPTTRKKTVKIDIVKGVTVNYLTYWCAEFRDPQLQGKDVPVRYDPDDASVVYLYINGRWMECISPLAAIFSRRSVKQIDLITKQMRSKDRMMGRKQSITAERIAHFIQYAEAEGKAQRQMWRDQEQLGANPSEPILVGDDSEGTVIENEVEADAADLQVYEDF